MRTNLPAGIASRAFLIVNCMTLIGRHPNRRNGTVLRANRATSASVPDLVFDEVDAFSRRALALEMRFIFASKIAEGR